MKKNYLPQLDGLRGWAAFSVALCHSFSVLTIDGVHNIWERSVLNVSGISAIITRLMMLAFNTDVAIAIFFIMSGYLLGISLDNSRFTSSDILTFYKKRFVKLYPVFFVIMACTVIYLETNLRYQVTPIASDWFNSLLRGPFTLKEFLANFLLFRSSLSIVSWTLVIEARTIVFFPILFYISRKLSRRNNFLFLVLLILFGKLIPKPAFIQFLFFFYSGLILPEWKFWFERLAIKSRVLSTFPYLIIAVGLASHDFIPALFRVYIVVFSTWLIMGIILYSNVPTLMKIFTHPRLIALGKISYPFYLLHFLVLYILGTIFLKTFPLQLLSQYNLVFHVSLALISVFITYGFSLLIHQYGEIKLMHWIYSLKYFNSTDS